MRNLRSREKLWQRILHDPRLLLHRMGRRSGHDDETPVPLEEIEAHFVPMTRRKYRSASHIDRRMATSERRSHRLTLRELVNRRQEIEDSANRVAYLFHTAFCGSTLLAGCLDHPEVCLAYKEPLSLTQVSLAEPSARRPPFMTEDDWCELTRSTVGLLSKVFHPSEVALIKPSNACNGTIPELLSAARGGARAILLYSNLTDFLCSILKSDGRRQWARRGLDWTWQATPSHRILSKIDKTRLSDAAAAAYVWLWQMYAYLDACESPESFSIRSLDCDVFFARPEETLAAVTDFLSLPLPEEAILQITSGETFRTYSKAGGESRFGATLERLGLRVSRGETFDAHRRRSLLRQTAERHVDEIETGLEWAKTVTSDRTVPDTLPLPLLTRSTHPEG
jgi:hypothetical protein